MDLLANFDTLITCRSGVRWILSNAEEYNELVVQTLFNQYRRGTYEG